jgi:hypothetical protein
MAKPFGEMQYYPALTHPREVLHILVQVNIGATGAPTVVGTSEVTVTRAGAGSYTMTFPAMADQATSLGYVRGDIVKSAAKTVGNVIPTALDLAAGTASFTTAITAGTAADPANGDILALEIIGNRSGVP